MKACGRPSVGRGYSILECFDLDNVSLTVQMKVSLSCHGWMLLVCRYYSVENSFGLSIELPLSCISLLSLCLTIYLSLWIPLSLSDCAQESFSRVGGLGTLTQTLIHFASDASHSPLACQLSVIMTKTVSACITDNRE